MRIKIAILLLHTFWKLILAEETSEINSDEYIEKMLTLELLKKETSEDFSSETGKDFDDLIEEVLGPSENSREYLFRIESPSEDQESSSTRIGKSFPIVTGVVNRDENFKPPIFIYEDLEDSSNRKKHVDSSHKPYPVYSFRTRYGIPLIGGFKYALGGSGELFKSDPSKPIANSGWTPSIPTTSLYFIKSEDNNNDDSYSSYVPADQFNLNNKGTSSIDTIKPKGSNFFTPHVNQKPFPTPPQRNIHNNVRYQNPQSNYESSYSSLNSNENSFKGTIGNGNHFIPANNYQGNVKSNSPQRPGVFSNISNRNEIDGKNDFQNTAVQNYYVKHDQNIRNNRPRVKAHYDFGYTVSSQGTSHGHQESRRGNRVEGVYHVDLPNGYRQIVRYYADETGYHPTIEYIPLRQRYAKSLSKIGPIKGKSLVPQAEENLQPPLKEEENGSTRDINLVPKIISRRNIIGTILSNVTGNSKAEEFEKAYLTPTTLDPLYINSNNSEIAQTN